MDICFDREEKVLSAPEIALEHLNALGWLLRAVFLILVYVVPYE